MISQRNHAGRVRRRALVLALMLALGAPLAAQAGGVCKTTPTASPPPSATGDKALACGKNAKAVDDNATAFGTDSQAGINDTDDPDGATLHGKNAVAVGEEAQALGDNDIALGAKSYAEGRDTPSNSNNDNNIDIGAAIGPSSGFGPGGGAGASGSESIAIGKSASTLAPSAGSSKAGQYGIALGDGAFAGAANTVAIGLSSQANASGAINIGFYDTAANGEDSVALDGNASGEGAVSLNGYDAKQNSVAINDGNPSGAFSISLIGSAQDDDSIAIGNRTGDGNVGTDTVLIGEGTGTGGNNDTTDSVALGGGSVSQVDATAIGYATTADTGPGGTVVGYFAGAGGANASVLGEYAGTSTAGDVAIGEYAQADGGTARSGGTSFAAGAGVVASDTATALGGWIGEDCGGCATDVGTGSVALGDQANSETADITLLGAEASDATGGAAPVKGVALGEGSSIYKSSNSVSVGRNSDYVYPGLLRQITNVAAATQDTDAINVGQLNAAIESAGGGSGGGADLTQAEQYIDAGDATTLKSANAYTDQQVGKMTADNSVVLTAARSHADAGDATTLASAKKHADAGDATTLASAKKHADAGDASNHDYADAQLKQALATARQYEQANDKVTLTTAEAYADQRIDAIAGIHFGNFEQKVDRQFIQQNDKLNRTGAIDAALAGMAASAAARGGRTRFGVALGAYHGQTAAAFGVQHVFGSRVALTLGAGFAGGGDHTVNLAIGIAL